MVGTTSGVRRSADEISVIRCEFSENDLGHLCFTALQWRSDATMVIGVLFCNSFTFGMYGQTAWASEVRFLRWHED